MNRKNEVSLDMLRGMAAAVFVALGHDRLRQLIGEHVQAGDRVTLRRVVDRAGCFAGMIEAVAMTG